MCKTPTHCTMPHHSASLKLYVSSSTLRKDLTSTHLEDVFMLLRFMLLYTETISMSPGYFWKEEQHRTFRIISVNLRCIGHARMEMGRCRPFWSNMGLAFQGIRLGLGILGIGNGYLMRGRFQALNGWSIDQLRAIIECDSLPLTSPSLHGPERASCLGMTDGYTGRT